MRFSLKAALGTVLLCAVIMATWLACARKHEKVIVFEKQIEDRSVVVSQQYAPAELSSYNCEVSIEENGQVSTRNFSTQWSLHEVVKTYSTRGVCLVEFNNPIRTRIGVELKSKQILIEHLEKQRFWTFLRELGGKPEGLKSYSFPE